MVTLFFRSYDLLSWFVFILCFLVIVLSLPSFYCGSIFDLVPRFYFHCVGRRAITSPNVSAARSWTETSFSGIKTNCTLGLTYILNLLILQHLKCRDGLISQLTFWFASTGDNRVGIWLICPVLETSFGWTHWLRDAGCRLWRSLPICTEFGRFCSMATMRRSTQRYAVINREGMTQSYYMCNDMYHKWY